MLRIFAASALLLLAACSDSSAPPPAEAPVEPAPPQASADPAPAEPSTPAEKSPAEILAGGMDYIVGPDGARGCKDKVKAEALVAASKKDDPAEMIELWAAGMQDQTCRGFTAGLGLIVETKDDGGWDCILSIDDPDNKTCFWVETAAIKENDVN